MEARGNSSNVLEKWISRRGKWGTEVATYGQKPVSSNKGVTSDARTVFPQWPLATNDTDGDRVSKHNQDTYMREGKGRGATTHDE